MSSDKDAAHPHISVVDNADAHKSGVAPRSSSGWDGKLRVDKKLELANPEALSDPEYSDEEQVLPGEEIEADEGTYDRMIPESILMPHQIS
jgi:protein phosphatase 1 regulatory subunit 7